MSEILIFIVSLLMPMFYYRGLFWITSQYFEKPFIRTKTGLKIHHLHYGIILIVVASLLLLLGNESIAVIILLGLGLGFMLDLFIPSLLIKSDRKEELVIYRRSLLPTIILFGVIITFIIIVDLIL